MDSAMVTLKLLRYKFLYLGQNTLSRFGQVLVVLGILMLIDANFKIKAKLFLKLGQNTFPIYVVHVIILYGGIFGLGLKPTSQILQVIPRLTPMLPLPYQSWPWAFFTLMVYFIEPLSGLYYKTLGRIRIWGKRK